MWKINIAKTNYDNVIQHVDIFICFLFKKHLINCVKVKFILLGGLC